MFRQLLLPFLLTVAASLCLLTSCDQKPTSQATPKPTKKKKTASPDVRFAEARTQMVNGQFSEAAEAFAEILQEPKIRQPLATWIEFHQGLALLLAGKESDARKVFGAIEDRGPFSKTGSDSQIADFFVKLSHSLRSAEAVPASNVDYDRSNFEGIAYLALGAKDWDMEKPDDASGYFTVFDQVQPEKLVEWADGPEDLKKLKSIGSNLVNDYQEFVPARKALDDAKTPEDQAAAVEAAKAARSRMKLSTKMSKSLDDTIADLGPKATAILEAKAKTMADDIAADEKVMTDAKAKRKAFLDKFQYAEAKTAISDAIVKSQKLQDEKDLLVKKTQWLANFKAQLVEDLAKKGYAKAIKMKSGETVSGGVATADEQQVTARTSKGPVQTPWRDIALESDFEMAQSFIEPDLPAEMTSFRKWHLGVFAYYLGKKKEALDLLHQAAEVRAVLKDELPAFESGAPF